MSAIPVGNPEPHSRTRSAAELVVERLTGAPPDRVVDVLELGAGLLAQGDPAVEGAVAALSDAEVTVVASTTCKATYTGLLKLFLDGHEQVAERIAEYAALGLDEFILSGYPHLEEAWRVGEEVLPLLARELAPA